MSERVAILGLGLMGGSLGLALRALMPMREIVGYDARPEAAVRALERGAITRASEEVDEALIGADLVVLAAPILALRDLLAEAGLHLGPDTVVTDLGSTKAEVVRWAEELLPAPERFVGGHPMVGSERSGIAAADAGLYAGCTWCLTPTARTSHGALAAILALITSLGATPHILDVATHDAAVAAVSHLPLVAATALTLTAAADHSWPEGHILAAGGFRDTTRVASGDPRMARDICLTNAEPLVTLLDAYIAHLETMRDAIRSGDAADVEQQFREGKQARDVWLAG
ncbi:MAG TPA: prephenate dehydrogenase/arogenate dehydrogenase family protein [Ktedonobacterales bacterium]|jgi:prephenate dehydrogenase|nr:prephenate dehydrogenase/arogenate dehydrogenase family protein [Ktedonobacterales bacterium]